MGYCQNKNNPFILANKLENLLPHKKTGSKLPVVRIILPKKALMIILLSVLLQQQVQALLLWVFCLL
jgi:hypothetical protein